MRADLREAVRQRFERSCGYCGLHEEEAGAALTVDHYRPRSRGGTDDLENLVYCCHACNEFKGDFWGGDSEQRILHPLRDVLVDHCRVAADFRMEGTTPTGECHITRLHLNRPELVTRRRRRAAIAELTRRYPELLERFAEIAAELDRLGDLLRAVQPPQDLPDPE
jgi:hypothetical protein